MGDLETGQQSLTPLRTLAGRTPLADTTGRMPYPALHDLAAMAAVSRPHAIRNAYLHALTDETIEIILDFLNRATSPHGVIALRELGGAMARVPVDAPPLLTATARSTSPPTTPGRTSLGRTGTSPGATHSGKR